MALLTTAAQTVGPFVAISFARSAADNRALAQTDGERIVLQGRVIDGDGAPVSEAAIETWQANSHGKYAHPEDFQEKPLDATFRGFGRVMTDQQGTFRLATIKPGRVPGPGGVMQAPHLVVLVFMRGLLKHLMTRVYFPDEPSNVADPVLQRVPADRRATLIARRGATEAGLLEWDVILQGKEETVFFDY
jgi:protocatechuate 3,4-dioxygenase, alpha subunit